jgi:hypothetical protein
LEERIGLYYQEEADQIPMPQGLSQRIVDRATSPLAEKPTGRRGFRLLVGGAVAAAATAALLVAALVIWNNVPRGTSTVGAAEILQRVEQTYQSGQPSEDIPVVGFSIGPVEGQPGETTDTLVLPSTELAEVLPVLREHYGARIVSEETLEGGGQYVLLLIPPEEGVLPPGSVLPPGAEIELWVDKETNLIRQIGFSTGPDCGESVQAILAQPVADQPGTEVPLWPGLTVTIEAEGATRASLLEDLSECCEVTVTSEKTIDGATHLLLSLLPKISEGGLSPAIASVWVDVESGKITRMSFVSDQTSADFELCPGQQ